MIRRHSITSVLWMSMHSNMFPTSSMRPIHTKGSSSFCIRKAWNLSSQRSCCAAPRGSNHSLMISSPPLGDPDFQVFFQVRSKQPLPPISPTRVSPHLFHVRSVVVATLLGIIFSSPAIDRIGIARGATASRQFKREVR